MRKLPTLLLLAALSTLHLTAYADESAAKNEAIAETKPADAAEAAKPTEGDQKNAAEGGEKVDAGEAAEGDAKEAEGGEKADAGEAAEGDAKEAEGGEKADAAKPAEGAAPAGDDEEPDCN